MISRSQPKQAWTPVAAVRRAGARRDQPRPGRDRGTRTAATSRSRSRTLDRCFDVAAAVPARIRSSGAAFGSRPPSPRMATYPFVRLERGEAAARRRRRRAHRLRQGRPERADRPADPRGARRGAAGAAAATRSPRACPSCARRPRAGVGRRFGVELDPDTEIVPTLGVEGGDLHARPARRRSRRRQAARALHRARRTRSTSAARCSRARSRRRCRCCEENGFLPDLDAIDRGDAATGRRSSGSTTRTTRPARVAPLDVLRASRRRSRREHDFLLASDEAYTELWFDEPPPSALQASDRIARRRLPDAVEALVDDRLPLGVRRGAGRSVIAALKPYRPTAGTAPQEFVQRASIAAWDDEAHVERDARAVPAQARRAAAGARRGKGCAVAGERRDDVPLGRGARRRAGGGRSRRGCSSTASSSRPARSSARRGEGYFRIALVPDRGRVRRARRRSWRRSCDEQSSRRSRRSTAASAASRRERVDGEMAC